MKTITIQVPDDFKVPEGYEVKIVQKEEKEEPVTYQDLIDDNIIIGEGYWIDEDSKICRTNYYSIIGNSDKNIAASEKVAKSMLAMAMISQLMPYYGGAISYEEWDRLNTSVKYVIENINNKIEIDYTTCRYNFLAFRTPEQRNNFLKYNEQLVKEYLMID